MMPDEATDLPDTEVRLDIADEKHRVVELSDLVRERSRVKLRAIPMVLIGLDKRSKRRNLPEATHSRRSQGIWLQPLQV